jgi:hypothetical protein
MCGINEKNSSYLSFLLQAGNTFRNFDAVFPQCKHGSDTEQKASHSGLILSEGNQPDLSAPGDARRFASGVKDIVKFMDRNNFENTMVFNMNEHKNNNMFIRRMSR